ncbi:MAG: Hpt domain-containing protein [Spirochaetaceae bacterium]
MAKEMPYEEDALKMLTQAEEYLGMQGHDKETIDEMCAMLEERAPELNGSIEEALAEGDAKKLRKAVHSLKGILSTLGIEDAAEDALRVEKAVYAEDMEEAETSAAGLVKKMSEFLEVLKKRSG